MAADLVAWGNKLYTGKKSYPIVHQRKRWFLVSIVLIVIALGLVAFKGLNPSIDFTGGTQYVVVGATDPDPQIALDIATELVPEQEPRATVLDGSNVRLQLGYIDDADQRELAQLLAEAYGVDESNISFDQIGPTWGAEVGTKALQGLVIFIVLVSIVMAVYFRNWRMSAASVVTLVHDLLITVGVYALVGFEVSPASVIGFLTILGYSLYDKVVVFDKVRENTEGLTAQHRFTYAELSNLAINQTLVRSINTSIVALLPVASILFIGAFVLGAGTLQDIALALFVGTAVGTYSSVFTAAPLEVELRVREESVKEHTADVLQRREAGGEAVAGEAVRVGALTPGHHLGVASQPRKKKRK